MERKIVTLGSLHTKHFSAHLDRVRLRNGQITERIRVDHPEAVALVAFTDNNHILMVRQWRYAIARETLEIPAGKVDPGEDPRSCAQRELVEETGYSPGNLVEFLSYFPAIGYSNERIIIYAASGLRRISHSFDEKEISKVEVIPLEKVSDLITNGSIQDGKTIIAISVFQVRKRRGELPAEFFAPE